MNPIDELRPHFIPEYKVFRHVYSGELCGWCEYKVNLLHTGHGWSCPRCKCYNGVYFSQGRIPYENPDHGPSERQITEAVEELCS
jgi:hypothetical protein